MRKATISRKTAETSIEVTINLVGSGASPPPWREASDCGCQTPRQMPGAVEASQPAAP